MYDIFEFSLCQSSTLGTYKRLIAGVDEKGFVDYPSTIGLVYHDHISIMLGRSLSFYIQSLHHSSVPIVQSRSSRVSNPPHSVPTLAS